MNKVQFRFFDVPQSPTTTPEDIILGLNREGSLGWRFVHGVGTPAGLKFLMQRETDEQVDQADVEAYAKAQKEAELLAKFAPGPTMSTPPPGSTVVLR